MLAFGTYAVTSDGSYTKAAGAAAKVISNVGSSSGMSVNSVFIDNGLYPGARATSEMLAPSGRRAALPLLGMMKRL